MAKSPSTPRAYKKLTGILVCLIVILALAAAGGYLYLKNRDLSKRNSELAGKVDSISQELQAYKTNPDQAAQAEVKRYVDEIGKLYALPGDETPSVATVKDKEQLKSQQFFARAENGDITLIYSNAKLAILYRPSTKQLVNVSTVTIQDKPTETPPAQP